MIAALEMPKTTPEEVATAILDGIAAEVEDIFPDGMARQMGQLWLANPKQREAQFAAMWNVAIATQNLASLRLRFFAGAGFAVWLREWLSNARDAIRKAGGARTENRHFHVDRRRRTCRPGR
ncbi:MAG: hypothetical protein HC822_21180 [Oscillochloris sp.]|nr:hypothetical protein [Oscillochloris sp.]